MKNEENIPEFGIKREGEERRDGGCAIAFDPKTQNMQYIDTQEQK